MFKKLFITVVIIFFLGVLSGCSTREYDRIVIYNKGCSVFDDVTVDIKDGHFYDRHEKFTVDEHTVAVTIFFVNENEDEWKLKE